MKLVKDQVYAALCTAFGEDAVTDSYPTNWAELPAIQYTEEENRAHESTNDGEERSYVRYRVDIWHNRSTSEAAQKVDQVIGFPKEADRMENVVPLGLVRTTCTDVPDPSGLKHKQMRFEGIINMADDYVEWP